ncbi:MAG: copper resistance protein NlpE N-terminal domain-containing protein [Anditalea sp.]
MILFLGLAAASNSQEKAIAHEQNKYADNSRNTQDWGGTYEGVVPCADCEAIKTVLTLNENRTFILKTTYQGKDDQVDLFNISIRK